MIERRGKDIMRSHTFMALHASTDRRIPVDKEEAERLTNELIRFPGNQFYDEHYRQDNPAMRHIVKDVIEFASILGRRGYGLICKDGYYIVSHGSNQTTVAEEFFKYQTVAEVARQLDRLVGQHHVQCALCGEPLIVHTHIDQEVALRLFQAQTRPLVVVEVKPGKEQKVLFRLRSNLPVPESDAKLTLDQNAADDLIAQATIMEYRSAKAGPDSPVLSECPGCHSPIAVEEIQDA